MYFFEVCKFGNILITSYNSSVNPKKILNVLKYLFFFNKINLINLQKIPELVVINNQKNFFSALYHLCANNVNIICFSSYFKRNSMFAYNTLLNINLLSESKQTVSFIFLDSQLSMSLCSRLSDQKLLCFKTVSNEKDLLINTYPVFANVANHVNVYMYFYAIQSFLQSVKVQLYLNLHLNYFKYLNLFLKFFYV